MRSVIRRYMLLLGLRQFGEELVRQECPAPLACMRYASADGRLETAGLYRGMGRAGRAAEHELRRMVEQELGQFDLR